MSSIARAMAWFDGLPTLAQLVVGAGASAILLLVFTVAELLWDRHRRVLLDAQNTSITGR